MIYQTSESINNGNIFLKFNDFIKNNSVYIKIENMNQGGSIKIKTAIALVDAAEKNAGLKEKKHVIESSSGNLGIALSIICAARKYKFTCVADKNTLPHTIKVMKAYGAEVIVIEKPDPEKGYLGSRLNYIRKTLMSDNNLVWTNQYECPDNSEAHARLTARELLNEFPVIDYLFVAAGTTGTLMGCVQTITEESPATKIIAVDTEGSVIFGTPPAPRYIPGMGASVPPPLFDSKNLFDMVQVSEMDTVQTCRMVAQRYGFLAGGSTGTVLTAIQHYSHKIPTGSVVAMISPDGGERYIDTIYSDEWCRQKGLLQLNELSSCDSFSGAIAE
ncbi:2,3-diaminopropionate biosynthesis protein SbnA [Prodigiosinella confusarubida]|uniref:cysteine synthase n=1 Tax=Serratia sp. (strain ATCC 39006) TaxID=104623 RepID=A0A2I5TJS7_SERS3|nr:2,3-diaminopropionate biosynthesis protein SbnA [Serratia sp. ATCC 39006]AUH00498.1 2,3-diaminopropionate biosynthesis protein SbnA [Serratia sp. ATCC 39006]AUH04818.1 2,3-diaminopropionate biosynthesis protein SbnA [Serratia sp. ATCC 39006]